ncbi:MAG: hypothetical protein HC831_02550 [Chloroflexia bacterium]|nr:hypothetical protein [Chloroflexia bacterium]
MKICNLLIISLLFALLLISSCNRPNLDGHWHIYYGKERVLSPFIWDIRNDTLFLVNSNYIGPDSFSYGRNKIEIIWPYETHVYKYEYYGDSCLLFNEDSLEFVLKRKYKCKLYEHETALKIHLDLPDVSVNEVETIDENDSFLPITSFVYLGKSLDPARTEYIQIMIDYLSQ